MFAYVLIGLELAILWAFFWHFFLRDTKQLTVSKPIWGVYEDHVDELTAKDPFAPTLFFSQQGAKLRCPQPPFNPDAPHSGAGGGSPIHKHAA